MTGSHLFIQCIILKLQAKVGTGQLINRRAHFPPHTPKHCTNSSAGHDGGSDPA